MSYVYGWVGMSVEQIDNEEHLHYLHHDRQGSTRLITSTTGTTAGKCSYTAYGTSTCEGATTTPLGYDGQYTNSDTGLVYLRARNYDSVTAQFLSRDPLQSVTEEPYGYASDDPVNRADRTGLGEFELEFTCPPFCAPPSPSEVLKEVGEAAEWVVEGTREGAEIVWSEVIGGSGCSGADGEALKREGEQLPGRKHGEAARERWLEWWGRLSPSEKKAYNKARGPKPRKGG